MPGKSTYWGPPMTDSQCAVFHFEVKTMTMEPGEPLVFETIAAVEQHCRQAIAASPTVGGRIYNSRRAVVATISDDHTYAQHHGRPAAKRTLVLGVVFLLAGICSVALDAWYGWRLVLGVILGARFLWVGTVKFSEGIAGLMDGEASQ